MEKKQKNERFYIALDYLYREGMIASQKDFAEKIGMSQSGLSRLMNGLKTVSDETIRKMNESFGGIFNMRYFRGECDSMLIADHPKEQDAPSPSPAVDYSFLIEKAVEKATAYADKTIALLESQLADKEEIISLLKQRIASMEAEHQIYDRQQPLRDYPFPVGVAEGKDKDSIRV